MLIEVIYQKLSRHEDHNTALESGLRIEGRDLVLDLLEREGLWRSGYQIMDIRQQGCG